jgi:hypothetical protein
MTNQYNATSSDEFSEIIDLIFNSKRPMMGPRTPIAASVVSQDPVRVVNLTSQKCHSTTSVERPMNQDDDYVSFRTTFNAIKRRDVLSMMLLVTHVRILS